MTTYKIAGVSRLNGEMKVRFANDMTRVKVLAKNGHTDVDLIELKEPMTKESAVAFLLSIDFATKNGTTNADVQNALLAEVEKRSDAPKAAAKPAKDKPAPAKEPAKKPAKKTKVEPSLESIAAKKTAPKSTVSRKEIEAQMAEMEDAPF